MADETQKITREHLESSFRAVKGDVDQRTLVAKEKGKPVAIAAAVLVILLSYLIGKRVGKRKSTIVEIRRI